MSIYFETTDQNQVALKHFAEGPEDGHSHPYLFSFGLLQVAVHGIVPKNHVKALTGAKYCNLWTFSMEGPLLWHLFPTLKMGMIPTIVAF